MGRDAAYYIGLVAGLILGAVVSAEVLGVVGFPQVIVSVVTGLILARVADRAYQTRQLRRPADGARSPACVRCGSARVGRFCARCGTRAE